jgi:hypothetical protein
MGPARWHYQKGTNMDHINDDIEIIDDSADEQDAPAPALLLALLAAAGIR